VLDSIRERLGALTFEKLEPPKAIKGGPKENGAALPSKDEEEEEADEPEPEGTDEARKIRKLKKVKKKKMKR
jgi:hypothetical protein